MSIPFGTADIDKHTRNGVCSALLDLQAFEYRKVSEDFLGRDKRVLHSSKIIHGIKSTMSTRMQQLLP